MWPRSHEKNAALAALAPAKHARFDIEKRSVYKSVGQQLDNAGVKDLSPVELRVSAGDVLFHDMLTAHSGSDNRGLAVRLAFNMKWGPSRQVPCD